MPADPNSDDVLIARYRDEADVTALTELIGRLTPALRAYLHGMTSSPEELEDIFQDTWLRVIRKAGCYRKRNFRAWVFRIAHNLVIDNSRRRRPDLSLDAPANADDPNSVPLVDTIPDTAPGPDDVAVSRDDSARILELVRALPDTQREVFLLRFESGLSFLEIAELLHIPLNTALARMHYAVTRLRKSLNSFRT